MVHYVYVFGDGKIIAVGFHGPGQSGPDAVVGGTGAYAGARGTITELASPTATGGKIAIRLLS